MKINIINKNWKKNIKEGCKNSEKKKNEFYRSEHTLENMISIRNILNSFADDSCFNKNFFRWI